MKTNILVNATTLTVGGGVQVGLNVITQLALLQSSKFQFYFSISDEIFQQLPEKILDNNSFLVTKRSPAKILIGASSRKQIKKFAAKCNIDLVYSLGFPSYVTFSQKEIGRYTNPWEFMDTSLAQQLIPTFEKPKLILKSVYRRAWAKKATWIETQTDLAKSKISQKLGFDPDKVFVIPNSINPIFYDQHLQKFDSVNKLTIFCLSADHPHKNLRSIPKVCSELSKLAPDLNPQFLLTLPSESETWLSIAKDAKRKGLENNIINLGVLNVVDCMDIYLKSNLVFLPTLLEVSSATYLESMAVGVPILTSDTDFSRDACSDYAVYFQPNSCLDAAVKINNICKFLHDTTFNCENHPMRAKVLQQSDTGNKEMISMLEKITSSEIFSK